MTQRTTIRLEQELLRQAKKAAAEQGRTLTSLLEEGLRLVLAESAERSGKSFYPRVSTSTGGTCPGIDLSSNAAMAAALDEAVPLEKRR